MLYQQSHEKWNKDLFKNPPACYRGAPFWAWNCLITKETIDEQLAYFKEMGMGGVHIHVRVGLKNQYMGDEFLELVRYCNEKAKSLGLLCWLYDEDRYASGYAGGEVTKNVKYRARYLRLTVRRRKEALENYALFQALQDQNEKVQGCLLKAYDIVLRDGCIESAEVIGAEETPRGRKWYLYLELEAETPWCNNQTYVDTMNEEATKCFIAHTHEKYASVLQEDFGKNIPAIFTDEPHFIGFRMPEYARAQEDILLPFTEKLPESYAQACGKDFFEALPYMIWNTTRNELSTGNELPIERYRYFDVCSRLFTAAYCKPIKDWCEEHGLLSTGHILSEETLGGQTACVGDAMRCYMEFQLPGIDNLCDAREFSAVKQAAGVAHQMDREGVLSELYGVTQWDFDFKGYKLAGDWQAALGVTLRVPHLAWASMAGEAKRDYPAAIGWQSPWYQEFSCIENHFARVNYCLTRGVPNVHIAVLHPVESMWLLQGPADRLGSKREQLEADFQNVTRWLLTGGLDFDYVAESVLEALEPEENRTDEAVFVCGSMKYQAVVIPGCISLRQNTWRRLQEFSEKGGKIIVYGQQNAFWSMDGARRSEKRMLPMAECVSGKENLLNALEPWRQIDIRGTDGKRRNIYLHQFRREGENRWLFLAQACKGREARDRNAWDRRKLHEAESLVIRIRGRWRVQQYETLQGEITEIESRIEAEDTIIEYPMFGEDSLLLYLQPAAEEGVREVSAEERKKYSTGGNGQKETPGEKTEDRPAEQKLIGRICEPTGYALSEPNALLLDKCFYSFDGEEEQAETEILKIDNQIRKQLGYPLRMESVEQPYVRSDDTRDHQVCLRFVFESETETEGCMLALEERSYSSVLFNGRQAEMNPAGFYVDRAIETIRLPGLRRGENELIVKIQYGRGCNLEWMYLLGDFGVRLYGSKRLVVPRPEKLFWGDYTRQGFPFYTGNMTYFINVSSKEQKDAILRIPYFSGAAVKIAYGEKEKTEKIVALLPHDCALGQLSRGENIIELTCLGNRYNGFGQLHMIGDDLTWVGPDSWRTEGEAWTETYRLKEMGILSEPLLYGRTEA